MNVQYIRVVDPQKQADAEAESISCLGLMFQNLRKEQSDIRKLLDLLGSWVVETFGNQDGFPVEISQLLNCHLKEEETDTIPLLSPAQGQEGPQSDWEDFESTFDNWSEFTNYSGGLDNDNEELESESNRWAEKIAELTKPCSIKVEKLDLKGLTGSTAGAGRRETRKVKTPRIKRAILNGESHSSRRTSTSTRRCTSNKKTVRRRSCPAVSPKASSKPKIKNPSPRPPRRRPRPTVSPNASSKPKIKNPSPKPPRRRPRPTLDKPKRRPHLCSYCPKIFLKRSHLRRHILIHTGEKPFACDQCDRCFRDPLHLKRHKYFHSGEKPYVCEFCGKLFRQSSNLNKHIRTHTPGLKPYSCDICGKKLAHSDTKKKHMLKQHGLLVPLPRPQEQILDSDKSTETLGMGPEETNNDPLELESENILGELHHEEHTEEKLNAEEQVLVLVQH